MIHRDYLIIGAGVAGAGVCEGIRKYDKRGSITMVGAEGHPPYCRLPLPREFLKSARPDPAKLYHFPLSWYAKNKVELRLDTVVKHFNVERRLAVLGPGQTIEFKKAVLATGSRPQRPIVAGSVLGNIFYLRTIRDALAIREVVESTKNVVIVGGGLLAAEAAASLREGNCKVTLMCRDSFLWQKRVDPETAQWLTGLFESRGVQLMLQETPNGFEGKTIVKNIQSKSGRRFPSGAVLLAIGTDLNLELVQNTPLSSPNGTPVNEYLETDEKGIFAVGDIALYPDRIFGGVRRCEDSTSSLVQGEVAGANITGKKRQRFEHVPHTTSLVFGNQFDFVGDFSHPPQRMELDGKRERRKFTAAYYSGDRLVGVLLCNRQRPEVQAAIDRFSPGKK